MANKIENPSLQDNSDRTTAGVYSPPAMPKGYRTAQPGTDPQPKVKSKSK